MLYHDVPIDLTLGTRRARAAMALLLALPGSAFLYQGQELALPEVLDLPDDARQDPAFLNGGQLGRDGCRIPMPWTAAARGSHGFSPDDDSAPWLPQPADWGTYAADAQAADDDSMLSFTQEAMRRRSDLRDSGDAVSFVLVEHPEIVAFERGSALVITNTGRSELTLPDDLVAGRSVVLCSAPEGTVESTVPSDATVWLR